MCMKACGMIFVLVLMLGCSSRAEHGFWVSERADRGVHPMSPDHVTLKFGPRNKVVFQLIDVEHRGRYPVYGTYEVIDGRMELQFRDNMETGFGDRVWDFEIDKDESVMTVTIEDGELMVLKKASSRTFSAFAVADNSRVK